MFKSYEYITQINNTDDISRKKWEYKIIDDDFEETGIEVGIGIWASAIDTYEKRNLNVAANLIRVFQWYLADFIPGISGKADDRSIESIIDVCRHWTPKYAKYADQVEKYLLLV